MYRVSYLPRHPRTVIFMSVPTSSVPSPPRSARPLAARKQQIDPLWSTTNPTSVISAKRQAVERVEGEPRNKRKRVEPTLQTTSQFGHRADKLQNDESPVVSWLYTIRAAILPPTNHDLSTTGLVGAGCSSSRDRWIFRPCRWKPCTGISLSTTLFLRCIHHRSLCTIRRRRPRCWVRYGAHHVGPVPLP